MTGDPLADGHHVVRYCPPSQVNDDGLPAVHAFVPRESDTHLSVNWLEYFTGDIDPIEQLRVVLDAKLTIKKTGRLVRLNVGDAKSAAHTAGCDSLDIEERPTEDDPSHAGIVGYTHEDLDVATALRSLVREGHVWPGK